MFGKTFNKLVSCITALLMVAMLIVPSTVFAEEISGSAQSSNSGETVVLKEPKARVSVHDPSIVKDGNTYYVFGSHIETARSTDLKNWTRFTNGYTTPGNVIFGDLSKNLAGSFAWAGENDADSLGGFSVWAPFVFWNETYINKDGTTGAYMMYYCTSSTYKRSAIGYAVSKTIEGPYIYVDTIIYSGFTSVDAYDANSKINTKYTNTNIQMLIDKGTLAGTRSGWFTSSGSYNTNESPNAIDPALFYDNDGKLWMTYGSWSGGIFMLPIDNTTGKAIYPGREGTSAGGNSIDRYFGTKIAGGYTKSGEGPFIVYDKETGYYYLYVTYEGLNATGGYNMRLFRSTRPDGPYVDAAGLNAVLPGRIDNSPIGIKLMGNYKFSSLDVGYRAPGHNSSFIDSDGQMYLVYHTRFDNGTEYHEVRVHQMFINEDGWPVVAPHEYNGDSISPTGYSMDEIAGTYEFINHGTSNSGTSMLNTLKVNLNKDFTITGDITGIWSMTNGTYYMKFIINGILYKGVFFKQNDESKFDSKVMTFSAVGSNNEVVWGSKNIDDNKAVQFAAYALQDKIPGIARGDIALPAVGDHNTTIVWSTSNKYLISSAGEVNRVDRDIAVTLTATITKGAASANKSITVTVKGKSYALDKNPVYRYDFNEVNSSTEVINQGSKSGNARLTGTASIVNDGQRGGVLQLTNAEKATKVNYLALPTDTFDGIATDGFTVAMWVNVDTANPSYWEHSALFEANAGGQNKYPVTRMSANLFSRINSNGVWADATSISKPLTGNKWKYVSYTVNSQGIAVYLNGVKVGAAHHDLTQAFSNNFLSRLTDVRVGSGNIWGDEDIASAKFDNVTIFNTALTEDEADTLYNKESFHFVLNKTELVDALINASNYLDNAVEGDKDALKAEVTKAEEVLTDSSVSQADLNAAAAALNNAIVNFKVITTVDAGIDTAAIARTKTAALSLTAKDQLGITMGFGDAAIKYFSSNPEIISVNDGVVTANGIGSGDITVKVTTTNGKVIQSNTITVQVLPILEDVTVKSDKIFLTSGATATLSVEGAITDGVRADLSKAQIVYSSDNEQIATVDANGAVNARGEGIVNIGVSVTLNDITRESRVKITVDTASPFTGAKIDGIEANGWYNSGVTVTLNSTDNLSGVDRIEYRTGSGDWMIYTGPFVVNQEGMNTLQYRSIDKAGNAEEVNQQTIQIDKTKPDFMLKVNEGALHEGGSFDDYLPLSFKAWDNLSGLAAAKLTINGTDYIIDTANQSGIDIDMAGKPGAYTLTIMAEDSAGNRLEKTFSFEVTTSIDSMSYLTDRYFKSGQLNSELVTQLRNNLNQAQHQLDIGRPDQAANHMRDFVKHLDNSNAVQNLKTILNADARKLIEIWNGLAPN